MMNQRAQVFMLLGGMWGWDGLLPGINAGMLSLGDRLKAAGFPVKTYTWNHSPQADADIAALHAPIEAHGDAYPAAQSAAPREA
jgi:hypothetical protein